MLVLIAFEAVQKDNGQGSDDNGSRRLVSSIDRPGKYLFLTLRRPSMQNSPQAPISG